MKTPLQIGITGGIGSGKSLITRIFQPLGVPVYDADSRAKTLMTTDGILVSQIKKEFGVLSYNSEGALNSQYISQQVFLHPDRLKVLNELVHPRVAVDYGQWVHDQHRSVYVLKEAALLFEAGSYKLLDKVIVVSATEELRIQRVLQRDKHRSAEQIKGIINNQMQEEDKLTRADYIIVNDESMLVIPQVLKLHNLFISQSV